MSYDTGRNPSAEDKMIPAADDKDVTFSARTSGARELRSKVYRTICVYASFITSGVCSGTFGPTLLQLEYYFEADTTSVAWGLTAWCLGYLIGSMTCGAIFGRIHHELSQCLAIVTYSITLAVCTFCGGLYGYWGLLVVFGIFHGYAFPAGVAYCFSLWAGNNWSKYTVQGLYLAWSLGATVGPLLTRQFLVPLPEYFKDQSGISCHVFNDTIMATNETQGILQEVTSRAVKHYSGIVGNWSRIDTLNVSGIKEIGSAAISMTSVTAQYLVNSTVSIESNQYDSVRYCYLTAGCTGLIPAVLFAFTLCKNGKRETIEEADSSKKVPDVTSGKIKSTKAKVIIHVLLFWFSFFYQIVEYTTFSLVSAFAVKELCWENKTAALLASVVFFSQGLGRLAGVPTANFISPRTMLLVDFCLQIIAYVMLLFVSGVDALMWISGAVAGFGLGTVYPSCLLHVSAVMRVTGRTSSALMMASSVAGMVGPVFVGYLFDTSTPKWFVYISIGGVLMEVVIFVIIEIYIKITTK